MSIDYSPDKDKKETRDKAIVSMKQVIFRRRLTIIKVL